MLDEFFTRPQRRSIKHLNIVPILDMLTTVIFFLLLSTSFMEYTKLTLPPSKTTVSTDNTPQPPALSPKILLVRKQGKSHLVFSWTGTKPGQVTSEVTSDEPKERRQLIVDMSRKMSEDFNQKNPGEKTIQVGLGSDIPYQDLISVMDGTRDKLPDVVLISYNEAEARTSGIGSGNASESK